MITNKQNILSIDLGGTYTRLGYFQNNELTELIKYQTPKTPEQFIEEFEKQFKNFDNELTSIGVGAAGFWDREQLLKQSINLPQYIDYPLWDKISKLSKTKVYLATDVELAVWGEAVYGLNNQYTNVLYINMGTGFSAGLYKDGKVFSTDYSPALRLSFTTTASSLKDTLINLACLFSPQVICLGGSNALANWDTEIVSTIKEAQDYLSKVLVYPLKIQAAKLEYPTLWGALELAKAREF